MSIDPRLMDRRREVAEDRARRNVGRLIRVLVVLGVVGALVWLLLSPLLSVKEVTTTGIEASSTHAALVDEGVLAGTPLILIRPGELAAGLERDPWVREATVELDWPNRVVVQIEERVPIAWVETNDGWDWRAVDGVALPATVEPDDSMPRLRFAEVPEAEAETAPSILGALRFADALSDDLKTESSVWEEGNGELWAEVKGFQVRLGRPIEMEAKALSLDALLDEEPDPGSILTLIAPTHPAILPPAVAEEGEEEQP